MIIAWCSDKGQTTGFTDLTEYVKWITANPDFNFLANTVYDIGDGGEATNETEIDCHDIHCRVYDEHESVSRNRGIEPMNDQKFEAEYLGAFPEPTAREIALYERVGQYYAATEDLDNRQAHTFHKELQQWWKRNGYTHEEYRAAKHANLNNAR